MAIQKFNRMEQYVREVNKPYALDNNLKIHGRGLSETDLTWAIVGEFPSRDDEIEKKPFCGKWGDALNATMYHQGMNRTDCWLTNALTVRPDRNNLKSREALEAIEAQTPSFWEEIHYLVEFRGIKTIIALGQQAMKMFGIEGSILKNRGSVYPMSLTWKCPVTDPNMERCDFVVIPTYSPAYMLDNGHYQRGGKDVSLFQVWSADFAKAKNIGLNGYTMLPEYFNTNPTVPEIKAFVDDAIASQKLVALDLETDGLNPMSDNIVTIGLSTSVDTGMSIRVRDGRNQLHYQPREHEAIRELIQRLLDEAFGFILQNAKYDLKWLLLKGFRFDWKKLKHDTMVLHHTLNPEQPHNLGYITSIYGDTRYWKDMGSWEEGTIYERSPRDLGVYNVRDCVVLFQILEPMLADLNELGEQTVKLYEEEAIPMIQVTTIMEMNGCPWDEKRKQHIADSLYSELPRIEKRMQEVARIPDFVDFRSSVLAKLFYGEEPANLGRFRETIEKSKPETKKYRDAENELKVFGSCNQIWRFSSAQFSPEKTPSGALATHDKSRTRFAKAAARRMDAIKNLKAPNAGHLAELADIERLLEFLNLFNLYASLEKLRTTYIPYRAGQDGRIHPDWRSIGTNTGRLSCKKPNLMNLPKPDDESGETDWGGMFRSCIKAPEGYYVVSADYSNLEVGTVAYESGEPNLINIFENRLNQHDINTRILFGIDETHPNWKSGRKAAKIFQFGSLNYGGGDNTVYSQMVEAAPELGLTMAQFKQAKANYFKANPQYSLWKERVQSDAMTQRTGKTAFGRIRIFYGQAHSIEKEALNFPCQSAAASIINRATIRLIRERMAEFPLVELILQIHDQLVFLVPKEKLDSFCEVLREEMEKPIEFYGVERVFPVDIEYGEDFQNLEKWGKK